MKTTATFALLAALAAPALAVPAQRNTQKAAPVATASAAPTIAPAVSATPAPATPKAAPATKAAKLLTYDQRAKIAAKEVTRDLKPWVGKNTKVTVRSALVPFNGDRSNPITGAGPIQIFVQQDTPSKGFFGRIKSFFNPYRRQTYLVNVDANGQAQILDRVSRAPQRRLKAFFLDKLALGSLFSDFVNSGRMTETVFTAMGAGGAALVNPIVSGALWMRVAQVVNQGITSQNTVRKTALADTVAWAQDAGKTGSFPTLMESYREYQANIAAADSGAAPIALCKFAEQLSINRL